MRQPSGQFAAHIKADVPRWARVVKQAGIKPDEIAHVATNPDHTVNMAFLGSSAPGDWAEGDFWGPLASETRAWLDHLSTGRPCALTTAAEARNNLAVTLAIEHAVASGKPVKLSPARASAAA